MAVKIDGTREVRHPGSTVISRDRSERICRAVRVVGFLLQRIGDHWISCSRLEVPVVHLHRAYSRARLVGAAWTSPFELICNVRRVPRLDAVCGDRIEATGDRNMLGYAARVATRFRCRVRHSGSIHTTSRSFNLADRDARHCCHGGQAGHTDGVPTNIDRRQGGGLGCSACVQKSKPALHDDLVQRRFVADRPNTLWVTDITEHCTREGTVHCCAMLDVYSRMIVGWSIADHIRTSLVVDALQMACWRRRPPPGTICHGNQGNTRPGVRAPAVHRCVQRSAKSYS